LLVPLMDTLAWGTEDGLLVPVGKDLSTPQREARLQPTETDETYKRAYPKTSKYQYLGPWEAPRPFTVVVTRSRYAALRMLSDRYAGWAPKEDSWRTPVLVDLEWRSEDGVAGEFADPPLVQLFLPNHDLMMVFQPQCFELLQRLDGTYTEQHDSPTTVQLHLRKLFEEVGRYNFYTFAGYNDLKVLRHAFDWQTNQTPGLTAACVDLKLLYEQALPKSEFTRLGSRSLSGMAERLGPLDGTAPVFDKSKMGQSPGPLNLRADPLDEGLLHRLCADMHALSLLHDHLVGGLRNAVNVAKIA
jgi:hypothetical protein